MYQGTVYPWLQSPSDGPLKPGATGRSGWSCAIVNQSIGLRPGLKHACCPCASVCHVPYAPAPRIACPSHPIVQCPPNGRKSGELGAPPVLRLFLHRNSPSKKSTFCVDCPCQIFGKPLIACCTASASTRLAPLLTFHPLIVPASRL